VLHDGAVVEPLGLLGYLARSLPHYMIPRYLRFIDALPRSATNKIQRALLKKAPRDPSTWDRKAHGVNLRDLIGPGT
jgi:crotonobetaine/carnitine-CoA ligase